MDTTTLHAYIFHIKLDFNPTIPNIIDNGSIEGPM